jgi:hypothetical protein
LCEHHQLVTWLNERTLFAARSKRCSSITCIIELFSAARLISLKRGYTVDAFATEVLEEK